MVLKVRCLLFHPASKTLILYTPPKENLAPGQNTWDVEHGKYTESDQKSNQKIIELIKQNSMITINELMEKTGLSESGVKKIIRNLKAHNIIRRVGADKGGHWKIIIENGCFTVF